MNTSRQDTIQDTLKEELKEIPNTNYFVSNYGYVKHANRSKPLKPKAGIVTIYSLDGDKLPKRLNKLVADAFPEQVKLNSTYVPDSLIEVLQINNNKFMFCPESFKKLIDASTEEHKRFIIHLDGDKNNCHVSNLLKSSYKRTKPHVVFLGEVPVVTNSWTGTAKKLGIEPVLAKKLLEGDIDNLQSKGREFTSMKTILNLLNED